MVLGSSTQVFLHMCESQERVTPRRNSMDTGDLRNGVTGVRTKVVDVRGDVTQTVKLLIVVTTTMYTGRSVPHRYVPIVNFLPNPTGIRACLLRRVPLPTLGPIFHLSCPNRPWYRISPPSSRRV